MSNEISDIEKMKYLFYKTQNLAITDLDANKILYGKENFKNPSLIVKRSKNL